MDRRLNVTLPEETVRLIDRAAERGDRSRFIDQAVKYFARQRRRASLRKLLKEGAARRASRDLLPAEEWSFLEEESWQRSRG